MVPTPRYHVFYFYRRFSLFRHYTNYHTCITFLVGLPVVLSFCLSVSDSLALFITSQTYNEASFPAQLSFPAQKLKEPSQAIELFREGSDLYAQGMYLANRHGAEAAGMHSSLIML